MISPALRRELNKLREIAHFLLAGADATPKDESGKFICYFCLKPMDDYTDFETHGNATGPKFAIRLTTHHLDGNHTNNTKGNKALCHTTCHKRYHRTLLNMSRREKVAQ